MTNDELAALLVEKGGPGSGRYPAGSGKKWGEGESKAAGRAGRQAARAAGAGTQTAIREYMRGRAAFRRERRAAGVIIPKAPKVQAVKPAAAQVLPAARLGQPQPAFAAPPGGPGGPPPGPGAGEAALQGQAAQGVAGQQALGGPGIGHPGSGSVEQLQANIERLASTPITKDKLIGSAAQGNVSVTRMLTFEDGSKAVFKPEEYPDKDMPVRQNISPLFNTQREVGAWHVAKVVGMEDMVPAVIPATIKGEKGALMAFVPGEKGHEMAGLAYHPEQYAKFDGKEDHARAAVFDYVIGNEDRHQGNWLMNPKPGAKMDMGYYKGSDLKIGLIDHGLSFPDHGAAYKVAGFNQKMAEGAAFRNGMPNLNTHAAVYVANKEKILAGLREAGVPKGGIKGVSDRIDKLASLKQYTDPAWSAIGARYKMPKFRW